MNIISKIFYGLFVTLLLSIAGVFVASLIKMPGNIEIKIVKSGSMEPAIMTGALVVVKPSASYKVGDVITFGEDTKIQVPTSHRITAIKTDENGTFYTTKGDANEEADSNAVSSTKVIGKVIFSASYVGYILDFAKRPVGFALLVGVPAALIVFDELTVIYIEVKKILAKRKRSEEEGDEEPPQESSGKEVWPRVVDLRGYRFSDTTLDLRKNRVVHVGVAHALA